MPNKPVPAAAEGMPKNTPKDGFLNRRFDNLPGEIIIDLEQRLLECRDTLRAIFMISESVSPKGDAATTICTLAARCIDVMEEAEAMRHEVCQYFRISSEADDVSRATSTVTG